jgi:hypothetical protein
MANVTVTSAANFIPEIWANQALLALKNRLVLANFVTTDSDIAPFTQGDILHLAVPGTFTANNKVANTNVTLQVPTDSVIDVTLNKHKEVSFLIEDIVRAQQNQDVMGRYIRNAVTPLAEAIEADLFALYAGLSQSVGTSGTDLTPAVFRAALQKMMAANIDVTELAAVVSAKDYIALLGDANLATYFANTNPNSIREAQVGRLYGSTINQSNMVPVVAGAPNSTKNLMVTPDFAVLATRGMPTDGGGAPVDQRNYADPDSGLTFRMTTSYNASALGVQVTFDVLYGVAELRDLAGVVMLA